MLTSGFVLFCNALFAEIMRIVPLRSSHNVRLPAQNEFYENPQHLLFRAQLAFTIFTP